MTDRTQARLGPYRRHLATLRAALEAETGEAERARLRTAIEIEEALIRRLKEKAT